MPRRTLRIAATLAAALLLTAGPAWGIGFVLGETKEELKLEYDVAVEDHKTGRVTVVFTLADEGRLAPLDEVEFAIPGREKNAHGGHWMDLVTTVEMRPSDGGTRVGRVHIRKEWAERAEIRLNTHTMDGNTDPLTRLHHVIRVADVLNAPPPASPSPAAAPAVPAGPAPPASERK